MCGKKKVIKMSVISSKMSGKSAKMSGKSAKCVTMGGCVTNLLFRPKMSKNTPNERQLAGMSMFKKEVRFHFNFLSILISACATCGDCILFVCEGQVR